MKNFILQLVIIGVVVGLVYMLFNYKKGYSNAAIEQYQKTIDSLALEMGKKDKVINSLDSTRVILDSLLAVDKAKLADIAAEAQQYKDKYEKERGRINDMSDDDVISEFTATFK